MGGNFKEGGLLSTAILISTFDRYESLARWTAGRIQAEWQNPPPVFFSGLSKQSQDSPGFTGDSKDWMGVTLQAVQFLRGRGFSNCYLILDDHPPMGSCHARFLNEILPRLAQRIDAAHISLLGYGQHRRREGRLFKKDGVRLEQLPLSYRWKFSLHPGLWSLVDLEFVLERRMIAYAGTQRSPWNFERHRDAAEDAVSKKCGNRCYRVHGSSSGCKISPRIGAWEAALRLEADIAMFLAKLLGGAAARARKEKETHWRFGHYAGPYPIYWSGCLRQGKVHADFEKWLTRFSILPLRESWKSFVAHSGGFLLNQDPK
jgi:hypothetical protein